MSLALDGRILHYVVQSSRLQKKIFAGSGLLAALIRRRPSNIERKFALSGATCRRWKCE
ncbi:MAG: hypothetical protein J2P52_00600 [Blastocatellia bacterium]|nr:hypothetical protein [Blastocatellia bacterium]